MNIANLINEYESVIISLEETNLTEEEIIEYAKEYIVNKYAPKLVFGELERNEYAIVNYPFFYC